MFFKGPMKEDKQEGNTVPELPDHQSTAPVGFPQNLTSNKPLSASQGSLRSVDNDSSATMSADEAHPSDSHTHREQQSESCLYCIQFISHLMIMYMKAVLLDNYLFYQPKNK